MPGQAGQVQATAPSDFQTEGVKPAFSTKFDTYADFKQIKDFESQEFFQKAKPETQAKMRGIFYEKKGKSLFEKHGLTPPSKEDFSKGHVGDATEGYFQQFKNPFGWYQHMTHSFAEGKGELETTAAKGVLTIDKFLNKFGLSSDDIVGEDKEVVSHLKAITDRNKAFLANTDLDIDHSSIKQWTNQLVGNLVGNQVSTIAAFEVGGEVAPIVKGASESVPAVKAIISAVEKSKPASYVAKKVFNATDQYFAMRATGSDPKEAGVSTAIFQGAGPVLKLTGMPFRAGFNYLGKLGWLGEGQFSNAVLKHIFTDGRETGNKVFDTAVEAHKDILSTLSKDAYKKEFVDLSQDEKKNVVNAFGQLRQDASKNLAGHNPEETVAAIKGASDAARKQDPDVDQFAKIVDEVDKKSQGKTDSLEAVAQEQALIAQDHVNEHTDTNFSKTVEEHITPDPKGNLWEQIVKDTDTYMNHLSATPGAARADGPEFIEGLYKTISTRLKFENMGHFFLYMNALRDNGFKFSKATLESLNHSIAMSFPGQTQAEINQMSTNLGDHIAKMLTTDKGMRIFNSTDLTEATTKWQEILNKENRLITAFPEAKGQWTKLIKTLGSVSQQLSKKTRTVVKANGGKLHLKYLLDSGMPEEEARRELDNWQRVQKSKEDLKELQAYILNQASKGKKTTAGEQLGMSAETIREYAKKQKKGTPEQIAAKEAKAAAKPIRAHDIVAAQQALETGPTVKGMKFSLSNATYVAEHPWRETYKQKLPIAKKMLNSTEEVISELRQKIIGHVDFENQNQHIDELAEAMMSRDALKLLIKKYEQAELPIIEERVFNGKEVAYVTKETMEAITKISDPTMGAGKTYLGVNLSREEGQKDFSGVVNALGFYAKDNPTAGKLAEYIADKDSLGVGEISFVLRGRPADEMKQTFREELTHGWQTFVSNDDTIYGHLPIGAWERLYNAIPKQTMEYLDSTGYRPTIQKKAAVYETAAKFAAGQWNRIGVSKEVARSFLLNYFEEVKNQHGPEALDSLTSIHPDVKAWKALTPVLIGGFIAWEKFGPDGMNKYLDSKEKA